MTEAAIMASRICRMHPVTVSQCFGWLHIADEQPADIAVVLCTGIGRDGSNAHRSFRVLADRLAASRYPTLRFDYPGCGDSLEPAGLECWPAWRQSVAQAADWVRATTQARRLVLVGFRLGASLAALEASVREDVAGLVLIEPVLRGRSFVTQLTVEARLRAVGNTFAGGIEVNELRLTTETLESIAAVNLRDVTLGKARHVSVYCQADTPVLSACARSWRQQGVSLVCQDLSGLEVLLRPSHLTGGSLDPSPIMSWLQAVLPPDAETSDCEIGMPSDVRLRPAGCVETPVGFGDGEHLFGMLCCPAENETDLVVIICNTGGDPHYGFARFSVQLARNLAAAGVASLRMDFAGLGDSSPRSIDAEDNHVFTVDRTPDLVAALDILQEKGYRRFAVNGLCSGAYHALHGALDDPRVGALLLVNLPFLTMRLDRPGPNSFARRIMAELSRRQLETLLLFAENDAGLKPFEQHFGLGDDKMDCSHLVIETMAGLDHDLTGSSMRRDVAQRMIEFLRSSTALCTREAAE